MLYACGLAAPDPFLWFCVADRAAIVVSPLELGRARKEVRPGVEVLSLAEAAGRWGVPGASPTPRALIAGLARSVRRRLWHVPASFPLGLADALRRDGVRVKPLTPFLPQRVCKTELEISRIREGVRLAEAGLQRALDVLRGSAIASSGILQWGGGDLTAETLRGEIDATISRLGGSASHTIAAPGPQGADPHAVGTGVIRAHVPVILDIFPRVDRTGYFGDLTRTVVKGAAPDLVKAAFAAVSSAQAAAIRAVRPGAVACHVHRVAAQTLARGGFRTDAKANPPHGFFHGTGHGLGLEIHEAPRLAKRVRTPLAVGNVVTVEPGVYYPEWGGVRLEDVVAVRESGCENLTNAPITLEIP